MPTNVETFVPTAWTVLDGILRLDGHAFTQSLHLRDGPLVAIAVVLGAGLSQAIGQSIVLFANRVKPSRFVASLAISALLFASGYVFLTLSTWAVSWIAGHAHPQLRNLWIVMALSYAPYLFSFFESLPYVGIAIMWLLRVWQLLATLVGFGMVAHVSVFGALVYVGLGWLGLVIVQQTFGRPIAQFGVRLMNAVSGVELESDAEDAVDRVQSGLPGFARVEVAKDSTTDQQHVTAANPGISELPVHIDQATGGGSDRIRKPTPSWLTLGSVFLVIVLFLLVLVALRPLSGTASGSYHYLPAMVRVPLDLALTAVVALLVAAILAPLDTLGWWAGWFGDQIEPPPATPSSPRAAEDKSISRYIVYLDGIAQSSSRYTRDIEAFLDALEPALPKNARFIRGLMVYSVFNRPLDEDPITSGFWKFVDKTRVANPASVLGLLINIRNILIVAVSSDPRYGPIYNYGIARLLYDGLIANGYRPGSGIPVTLIGYSGGAQMSAGAANILRRAIEAPIDLITLGGVMSGSGRFLDLDHVYQMFGLHDDIQKLGLYLFPSRWRVFALSYWNRALRLGRISEVSLGPVGHMEPGGMFDAAAHLPDGRTHLQQTLDNISRIVRGRFEPAKPHQPKKKTNYGEYVKEPWNRPGYYPIGAAVDADRYYPLAQWMGRLILPKRDEREDTGGVLFEVHCADQAHTDLVGKVIKLRWQDDERVRQRVRSVTHDLFFSADAQYSSTDDAKICPTRLDHWQQVDPLESLAGSRPLDDVMVMLEEPVQVDDGADPVVRIAREPVQIGGRYCGLIKFLAPESENRYRVAHFNRSSRAFDGPQDVVRVPPVAANPEGRAPTSMRNIERSPFNDSGWYVYGAPDASGNFVIQGMGPRELLRVQPKRELSGRSAAYRYVRSEAWADLVARKGSADSIGLPSVDNNASERPDWKEGDSALLIHVFGGVGGQQREAAAAGPVYLGHFAYGRARSVRDRISDELRFDITYYQVYGHNEDGLIAGAQHWSRYMADRQFGWLGERPVCDILVRHDGFTSGFQLDSTRTASVLDALTLQLEAMAARYRIGGGTGCSYVGPANNCAQDSNRALFAVLGNIRDLVANNAAFTTWANEYPEQLERYHSLDRLIRDLSGKLQTFGAPRHDWATNEYHIGSTMEDHPLQQLWLALGSWRMALPRFASDTIVKVFLRNRATAWALFYDQVGGDHPEIEPIAPLTL